MIGDFNLTWATLAIVDELKRKSLLVDVPGSAGF